ncbi:MAG TPA: response regulator [Ferruginibacter sp.]|nr:response regulator [Ferruginibacter sp.]
MVIDDSPELLEVFKAILERQGYEIIAKNSPRDIYAFVQNNRINILFLDVILQNINGKTICKEKS